MVTDPPYGVNYQPAFRHMAYPRQRTAVGRVTNDTQADWAAAYALFPGDVTYVWHAALFADVVMAGLRQAQFEVRSQIIWAKPTFVLGRGAYHWQHEPVWFAVRQGRAAPWYGGRTQSTVWEVPNLNAIGGSRTGANTPTGYATQKPVRVFEIPILNHTTAQDAVYDPFVGSGTALIAGGFLSGIGAALAGSMANKSNIVIDLRGWRTPSVSGEELQALGKSGPRYTAEITRGLPVPRG